MSSKLTVNLALRQPVAASPWGPMGGFDMTAGHFYWVSSKVGLGSPRTPLRQSPSRRDLCAANSAWPGIDISPKTFGAYGFYNLNFGWEWSTGRGYWACSSTTE